jgi:hypothetical protein
LGVDLCRNSANYCVGCQGCVVNKSKQVALQELG